MINPRLIKATIAAGATILTGAAAYAANRYVLDRKLKKAESTSLDTSSEHDEPSKVKTPEERAAEHGEELPPRGPDRIDEDETLDDADLADRSDNHELELDQAHGQHATVDGIQLFTSDEVDALGRENLPDEFRIMSSKTGEVIEECLLHAAEELTEDIADDAPLGVDRDTGLDVVPGTEDDKD